MLAPKSSPHRMKAMTKSFSAFFILLMVMACTGLSAQPAPPGNNEPAPLGGIALLAAAGAALGAKKAYDRRQDQDPQH